MLENRVRETSDTVGTGPLTLNGAIDATHQSFSQFGDGNPAFYTIINTTVPGEFEIGIGTYVAPDILQRTTVYLSSNSNNRVSFSAGNKSVFNGLPKEYFQVLGTAYRAPKAGASGKLHSSWLPTGTIQSTPPVIDNAAAVFDGTSGELQRHSPSVTFHPVDGGDEDKVEFAAIYGAFETATDGSTVTFDFDLSNQWQVTYGGNRTIVFDNASIGQVVRLLRYQDATGNRVETWPSGINWDRAVAPTQDTAAYGWDLVELQCIGIDGYGVPQWVEISRTSSSTLSGSYQPVDAQLTALAALNPPTSDYTFPIFFNNGTSGAALSTVTPAALTVLGDTTVAAMRATLGTGTPLTPVFVSGGGVAAVNTFIHCYSGAGASFFELPASPADGDRVGIRYASGWAIGQSVSCIPNTGQTIAFETGTTSAIVLNNLGEYVILQYRSSNTRWYILETNVLPLALSQIATSSLIGRATASTGQPEVLTGTQVRTILGFSSNGSSLVAAADYAAMRTLLSVLTTSTDGALAANSDTVTPSQKAVKTYVDNAVTGLLDFKGSTDCSSNPNYPIASKGDAYVVSVAGKIGGASGTSVEVGDVYVASADNAGGAQASVGTSWFTLQHNLVGALLTSNNLSDLTNTAIARSNLGLVIGTNVQAYDAELAAIAALTSAADKGIYFTGSGAAATFDLTSVARTLAAQTTQALMRTTGLGMSANGSSLVSAADYAAMRLLLTLSSTDSPTFGGLTIQADAAVSYLMHRSSTNASGPNHTFWKSRGTIAAQATVVAGDTLGNILFQGNAGGGNGVFVTAAAISAIVESGVGSGSDMPGTLAFWTTPDGSGTQLRRMSLDSIGNLLLGTTSSPTANSGKCLVFGDNGATDPTLAASTCALYQKTNELYVKDASGNVTLISPHRIDEAIEAGLIIPDDDLHPQIGHSYNVYTGRGVYTYRGQSVSYTLPPEEVQDWEADQVKLAEDCERNRASFELRKIEWESENPGTPFNEEPPASHTIIDPPKWMQRRGVRPVDMSTVVRNIKRFKQVLGEEARAKRRNRNK